MGGVTLRRDLGPLVQRGAAMEPAADGRGDPAGGRPQLVLSCGAAMEPAADGRGDPATARAGHGAARRNGARR